MDLLLTILSIVLCILVSAYFSLSETGLIAASRARLHRLTVEGNKRAKIAFELRNREDRLIGGVLLGNNLFNILASSIATSSAIAAFGKDGIMVATIIMTVLILIFGEFVPKTYALQNADRVALSVAPVWFVLVRVFSPITSLIQVISDLLLRTLRITRKSSLMDGREALRGAIDLHHDEGAVVKHDRDMLDSILDLSEVEVAEIMIHRKNMITLNIDLPPQEIISQAVKSNHSRLPIWKDNPENIIGILHVKDLIKLRHNPDKFDIESLIIQPRFVPDTTMLRDQLQAFRGSRSHMALVVDEYGALMGLVTLEDILEEIVGQIDDEHDRAIKGVRIQSDGSCVARGNVTIRDLNRELDWDLPDDEATTIAGLVINAAERIPEAGEEITQGRYSFRILRKTRNQITSIKISRAAG